MNPALAARVLALPPDVRATLAGVPGPGWRISTTGHAVVQPALGPHEAPPWYAWWSANPAQALAAVLGVKLAEAYRLLAARMWWELYEDHDNDHAAALAIIEAHVASRNAT